MKTLASLCGLVAALVVAPVAWAQVAVQPAADQQALLVSADARLAANKRLVYDFWREVFEGGHMEFADKYMAESYIQHNPNVPSGRAAFVDFFTRMRKPAAIEPRIKAPLVAIVAEGDLVVLSFAREGVDPKDAAKKLEGTYEVLEVLAGGKPDPKKDEVKSVEIKDGQIIIKAKRDEPAKFTLDPSKKPGHIDISPGKEKLPGIYAVKETDKGTELTIAFSMADKAERPKDFKGAGKEDVVMKLFRKKAQ